MEYLTVGTDVIRSDLFRMVEDKENDSVKPRGGLWLTEYDPQYSNYNVWVDFLINNPDVLFYKNHSSNIWHQPCALVKLNDQANIFQFDSGRALDYLLANYPLDNERFSYQLLSKKYDGIFVNIMKLIRDSNASMKYAIEYGVSSLLLFNLDCIDYYQSGNVLIEPFDLEYYMYENGGYEIKHEKVRKRVK